MRSLQLCIVIHSVSASAVMCCGSAIRIGDLGAGIDQVRSISDTGTPSIYHALLWPLVHSSVARLILYSQATHRGGEYSSKRLTES